VWRAESDCEPPLVAEGDGDRPWSAEGNGEQPRGRATTRKVGVIDKRGARASTGGSWLRLSADGGGQKANTSVVGGEVTMVLDRRRSSMIMRASYPQPCG
jgi:hypothetical protein